MVYTLFQLPPHWSSPPDFPFPWFHPPGRVEFHSRIRLYRRSCRLCHGCGWFQSQMVCRIPSNSIKHLQCLCE